MSLVVVWGHLSKLWGILSLVLLHALLKQASPLFLLILSHHYEHNTTPRSTRALSYLVKQSSTSTYQSFQHLEATCAIPLLPNAPVSSIYEIVFQSLLGGWIDVVFAFLLWLTCLASKHMQAACLLTSRQSSQSHDIITISSNALLSLFSRWGSIIFKFTLLDYSVFGSVSLFISSASKFMLSFTGTLCSSWSGGSPTLGAGAAGERASLSLPTQNMSVALILLLLDPITCALVAWLFLVLVTRLY